MRYIVPCENLSAIHYKHNERENMKTTDYHPAERHEAQQRVDRLFTAFNWFILGIATGLIIAGAIIKWMVN